MANTIKKFSFTSTSNSLLKEVSYYVSNQLRISWDNSLNKNNSNDFVEIVGFSSKTENNKHKNKHYRNGIFTSLLSNVEYHINFEGYSFTFNQVEEGPQPTEDPSSTFEFYKRIYMETSAPENIISNLLSDAEKLYARDILNQEDFKDKTCIYMYDEGYWEHLTSREPRTLDTIYLPTHKKSSITNSHISIDKHLENFLNPSTKEKYFKLGIPYKCNYLLEGHWGTGKTSLITALATHYGYGLSILPFSSKLGDVELFRAIKRMRENTFLILEDIDSLFIERKSGDTNKNRITFSGLLNILDGIATPDGLITFITTNHKNKLDPALIRPGRIDYVMKFGYITKNQIKSMFIKFSNLQEKEEQNNKFIKFWDVIKDVECKDKLTTGLLQQYLFKYLDDSDAMIENVEELKDIYQSLNEEKNSNLYN